MATSMGECCPSLQLLVPSRLGKRLLSLHHHRALGRPPEETPLGARTPRSLAFAGREEWQGLPRVSRAQGEQQRWQVRAEMHHAVQTGWSSVAGLYQAAMGLLEGET